MVVSLVVRHFCLSIFAWRRGDPAREISFEDALPITWALRCVKARLL